MIPGMPDIPSFKGLEVSGLDALIGFGGAFAINMVFSNQWGVFSQFGVPILLADTVYSVKYSNSSDVSSAPVERGSFTDYNKVQNPYKASVTMVSGGGSATRRGAFIAQLEALSRSTLLYNVVTPEYVHRNANILGYDYVREPQNGARMIAASIELQEIRESSVRYESVEVENPADSPLRDAGEVQGSEAGESVLNRIVTSAGGLVDTIGDLVNRTRSAVQGVFQ